MKKFAFLLFVVFLVGCAQQVTQEVPAPGFEDVPEMIVVQDDGPTKTTAEEETVEPAPQREEGVPGCNYNDPDKKYVGRSPDECSTIDFDCSDPPFTQGFDNECGCGCEKVEEEVIQEPPLPQPVVREFVIEGDDRGLYPNSIEVNEGETVIITFKVRGEGTYFGGLDFRSDLWGDTGKIPVGEETTVEFTAKESAPFQSFWPASNRLKATGEVIVK